MSENEEAAGAERTPGDGARLQAATAELRKNLSETIKALRDDAIKGRANSGIEAEWLEDDEYYQGIDNANRAERLIKPTSPDGRVTIVDSRKNKNGENRSTVFVGITRPYVDAASARVADMLLPTDDRNWDIRPTPVPDLIKRTHDNRPAMDPDTGQQITKPGVDEDGNPVMAPRMMGGQPMMGANGQPMMMPVEAPVLVSDIAKQVIEAAKESADKARDQIDDWLVECKYHAEVRKVIEDSARIGTGILKGPFPKNVRRRAVVRALQGVGIVLKDEILPHSKRIPPWSFYPDPTCGENIQNGKYVFECDSISARELGDLKNDSDYLADAIDRILKEGPKNPLTGTLLRNQSKRSFGDKEQFVIWYFHGYLGADDLKAAGCECDGDQEQYPAIVVMVNDEIIKAMVQPLDSGEFPYDVMVWQARSGHWAGIGVARQMRTSQDGVNAGTRNLMDNAGLSGGPMLIIKKGKLYPQDGNYGLGPRKVYLTTDDGEDEKLDDLIKAILIPSVQPQLLQIIQFWMQRAEDETGLPMLLQGQLGKAPDTVGGMTMLNNNASAVLRRIARTFDDRITEPHIGRYYEWLLLHGEDDSAKGDFQIDARGSSALIERDMQNQFLQQMMGASLNSAYGLDPEKVAAEVLKSQRLDPKRLELTDEQKQQRSKSAPQDPRIAAALIDAKTSAQEQQADLAFKTQQADLDRALEQWSKQLDSDLESMKLSADQGIAFDEIKERLARDTMKLRTQVQLAMRAKSPAPQLGIPPTEPPGRAPDGMAFQR